MPITRGEWSHCTDMILGLYPNDQDCYWTITVPDGYHVKLTFTTFKVFKMHMYIDKQQSDSSDYVS